jgi:hypothetical protein
MVFLMFNDFRWEAIVHFVEFGGIVEHHSLNFLFIIHLYNFENLKKMLLLHFFQFNVFLKVKKTIVSLWILFQNLNIKNGIKLNIVYYKVKKITWKNNSNRNKGILCIYWIVYTKKSKLRWYIFRR